MFPIHLIPGKALWGQTLRKVACLATVLLAAAGAATVTATPAGATNSNYDCHSNGYGSTCTNIVGPTNYITNNYVVDYTHKNVCSLMFYSNGTTWADYCSGSSGNTELVCGSQIYGWGGGAQYSLDNDNLWANENNYQNCQE